jgi:hypothetical protein
MEEVNPFGMSSRAPGSQPFEILIVEDLLGLEQAAAARVITKRFPELVELANGCGVMVALQTEICRPADKRDNNFRIVSVADEIPEAKEAIRVFPGDVLENPFGVHTRGMRIGDDSNLHPLRLDRVVVGRGNLPTKLVPAPLSGG